MTAEENILILSKIIHSIINERIDDEMKDLGYEIVSSTDKRKEYQKP